MAGAPRTLAVPAALLIAAGLGALTPVAPLWVAGIVTCLVLGVVVVVCHISQEHLVFLAFVLLAFVVVEPAPVDVLVPLLFAGFLATVRFRHQAARIPPIAVALAIAFVGAQVLSITQAANEVASLQYAGVTLSLVLLGAFAACIAHDQKMFRWALGGYATGAVGTAIVSLAAYSHLIQLPNVIYDGVRLQGFFKDPNVFSAFLAGIVPFFFAYLENRRSTSHRIERLAVLTGVLLCLASILFAYSRGAWINVAVALVSYGCWRAIASRRIVRRAFIFAVVLVPTVFVAIGGVVAPNSYFTSRLSLQAYDTSRFENVPQGLSVFSSSPVLGHGPGSDGAFLGASTHDVYVKLLLENGLIGFIAFVGLLGGAMLVVGAAGIRSRGLGVSLYATATSAALLGLLVNGVVVDTLHWRHLWILVGIAWGSSRWIAASTPGAVAVTETRGGHTLQPMRL